MASPPRRSPDAGPSAGKAEATLKALGERGDIIKTMHRALTDHGLAEERGADQYVPHGDRTGEPVVGRVLGKGLAGDEMGERVYLVVDGVDGRVHHLEFADPARIEDVRRGMIVEAAPIVADPRAADRNIADVPRAMAASTDPSRHLDARPRQFERTAKTPTPSSAPMCAAWRRCAGPAMSSGSTPTNWRVPADIAERGMRYDLSRGGDGLAVRILSTLDLEAQIGSDGATWLDRELVSRSRTPLAGAGFGRDVADAMDRRKQTLVDMGHASRLPDGGIRAPADLLSRLERAEVTRVGRAMAAERGLPFQEAKTGEYVSGKLIGSTQLASGRFAMIDDGLGLQPRPLAAGARQTNRPAHHRDHARRRRDRVDLGRKRGWGI